MVLAGSTPLLRPSRGPQDFFETKIISKIRGHKRETLALGLLVLPHDGGLTLNHSSLSRNLKVNWSNGRNGLLTHSAEQARISWFFCCPASQLVHIHMLLHHQAN